MIVFAARQGSYLASPTRGYSMVYGQTDCFGVQVVYRMREGMTHLDYKAQREGEAIHRLMQLIPQGRVIHASILWNKNRYRSWVQTARARTDFAKAMFGRFLSRTTPRGRKYRQALKSMRQTGRDR
jgi:hypothetical protein